MHVFWLRSLSILSIVVALPGCVDRYGRQDYTGSGALIGGASGAVLGAAIDRRNPGTGALIGGAAGLITGGLIGSSMDEDRYRPYIPPPPPPYVPAYIPPSPPPPPPPPPSAPAPSSPQVIVTPPATGTPPTVEEVKSMCRSGLSDDFVLSQIRNTRAVYHLDSATIIDLKNAGVSEKVIQGMIATSADVVVAQAPPAPQSETIAISPGPDYYWCRGEWSWSGSAWIWIPGRWVAPPHRGAIWVETYWVHGPNGWYRVPGHWR